MKTLDVGLLSSLYREFRDAQEFGIRGETGQVIDKAVNLLGLSRSRVYDAFHGLKNQESVVAVAKIQRPKTGSKLPKLERELRDIEGQILSELYYSGRVRHDVAKTGTNGHSITVGYALDREEGHSYEDAIEMAERKGLIRLGVWNRFKLGRWMKDRGIVRKFVREPIACVTWEEPYANRLWMVDASPLNAVYLNVKEKRISIRKDLESGLTRLYPGSPEESLRKVYLYVCVDVHSKAFFAKLYAPTPQGKNAKHGGENSADWMDFISTCILPKDENIPFQGAPDKIYTDKHRAFESISMILDRLGVERSHHFPGNSRAKGPVESRISAIKRTFESRIQKGMVTDFNDFQKYLYHYQVSRNVKMGLYRRWLKSVAQNPIQPVTMQNIQDASIAEIIRICDDYGCVSINEDKYALIYEDGTVAVDRVNQKILIYKSMKNGMTAMTVDGIRLTLDNSGRISVSHGSYSTRKGRRETDWIKNRKSVMKGALNREKTMLPEDIVPEIPIERMGDMYIASKPAIHTHTPIAPDFTNSEEAMDWILEQVGVEEESIGDLALEILRTLRACKKKYGNIPGKETQDLASDLAKIWSSE